MVARSRESSGNIGVLMALGSPLSIDITDALRLHFAAKPAAFTLLLRLLLLLGTASRSCVRGHHIRRPLL